MKAIGTNSDDLIFNFGFISNEIQRIIQVQNYTYW